MIPVELLVYIRETLVIFAFWGVLTVSLNLEVGYLGLPQFGKVMFLIVAGIMIGGIVAKAAIMMAGFAIGEVGRYCTLEQYALVGKVNNVIAANPVFGVGTLLIALVLSAIVGGTVGIAMAYPAIKLREVYLGILLLVAAEILRIIGSYTDQVACGVFGMVIPDVLAWAGEHRADLFALLSLLLFALVYAVIDRVSNSPFGRMLKAIRDSEIAASVYGKDVVKVRIAVLSTASALASIAGVLLVFYNNYVNIGAFTPLYTFIAWAMLIIGGMGNNVGALAGVGIYLVIERLLIFYKDPIKAVLHVEPTYIAYVLFGILLIFILIYRPQGVIPEKPVKTVDFSTIGSRRRSEGGEDKGE